MAVCSINKERKHEMKTTKLEAARIIASACESLSEYYAEADDFLPSSKDYSLQQIANHIGSDLVTVDHRASALVFEGHVIQMDGSCWIERGNQHGYLKQWYPKDVS